MFCIRPPPLRPARWYEIALFTLITEFFSCYLYFLPPCSSMTSLMQVFQEEQTFSNFEATGWHRSLLRVFRTSRSNEGQGQNEKYIITFPVRCRTISKKPRADIFYGYPVSLVGECSIVHPWKVKFHWCHPMGKNVGDKVSLVDNPKKCPTCLSTTKIA